MRNILVVHKEEYLDRALHDVESMIAFEQQHLRNATRADLLAVIVMTKEGLASLHSTQNTCCSHYTARSATPFASDSVGVSGVWLLLTVSQPEVHTPASRQDSLDQALHFLRSRECLPNGSSVFPVSLSEARLAVCE